MQSHDPSRPQSAVEPWAPPLSYNQWWSHHPRSWKRGDSSWWCYAARHIFGGAFKINNPYCVHILPQESPTKEAAVKRKKQCDSYLFHKHLYCLTHLTHPSFPWPPHLGSHMATSHLAVVQLQCGEGWICVTAVSVIGSQLFPKAAVNVLSGK